MRNMQHMSAGIAGRAQCTRGRARYLRANAKGFGTKEPGKQPVQEESVGHAPDRWMVLARKPTVLQPETQTSWKPIAEMQVPAGAHAHDALLRRAKELQSCALAMYTELDCPVAGVEGSRQRVELGLRVQRARASSEDIACVCDSGSIGSPSSIVPSRLQLLATDCSLDKLKQKVRHAYSYQSPAT